MSSTSNTFSTQVKSHHSSNKENISNQLEESSEKHAGLSEGFKSIKKGLKKISNHGSYHSKDHGDYHQIHLVRDVNDQTDSSEDLKKENDGKFLENDREKQDLRQEVKQKMKHELKNLKKLVKKKDSSSSQQQIFPSDVYQKWQHILNLEHHLSHNSSLSLVEFANFTKLLCQLFHELQEHGRWMRRICDKDFPLNECGMKVNSDVNFVFNGTNYHTESRCSLK